ncbi:unnamed protein product [Closterium sp. NIES-54]
MALCPSSVPLRVPVPPPPESSLPVVPNPDSYLARAACPAVSHLLATVITNPSFESTAASALVAELVDFAACALGTDVLEDWQEDFECLAAAIPHLVAMLLAPDIPTPHSYAEAIMGPYSSQWHLHEEIWLRRPPGFTGSFPAGTQSSLRQPIYGLRQAPREWHDTLRTTLAALGFALSTADLSLFQHTDTLLSPFYILLYVDHLVLQRFGFRYSSPQSTPLPTGHSLSAPPSDESVEPSGPYPELVGGLIHRPEHWEAAKRVLRYLCSTSGMGLVLGGRGPVLLTGHIDASWELRWLTYLLTSLGEWPRSSPVLYVDNKAMIA